MTGGRRAVGTRLAPVEGRVLGILAVDMYMSIAIYRNALSFLVAFARLERFSADSAGNRPPTSIFFGEPKRALRLAPASVWLPGCFWLALDHIREPPCLQGIGEQRDLPGVGLSGRVGEACLRPSIFSSRDIQPHLNA